MSVSPPPFWRMEMEDYDREILFCEEVLNRKDAEPLETQYPFKGYPLNRWLYVRTRVEKYGMLWAIAAVIDGSVGYYSFDSAERLIESVLENRFFLCERTSAIYGCDASLEAASDFYYMEQMMKENPERAKRLMEFVERLKGLDWGEALTVSMLYPTMGI